MREITKEEKNVFEAITSGKYENFVLVSTEFDGVETAVIAAVSQDGEDMRIEPLAILVKPEFFKKLLNPAITPTNEERKRLN